MRLCNYTLTPTRINNAKPKGILRDFTAFASALDSAFAPNPALKAALAQVRRKVRRA